MKQTLLVKESAKENNPMIAATLDLPFPAPMLRLT
jgi:hypothetical protein